MKAICFLSLALTLFFSTQSFAKERDRDSNEGATIASNGLGKSNQQRLDKNYQVNAQVVGMGPSLVTSSGLQIAHFLNPDSLILFEITTGTSNTSWGGDSFGDHYDRRASSAGIHYKQFVANSFYWRGGIDYRKAKVDYRYNDWFSSTNNTTRSFEGDSFALNFQIGNQWQWENFTMGCDWFGYSLPVSSKVTSESVVSTTPASDLAQLRSDEDDYLKKGHINLLRFYLGLSF